MLDAELIAELDAKGKLGWKAAADLIKPFGPVAPNFGVSIRHLVASYQSGNNELPLPAQNHIVRLMKNNTIRAVYYFVCKAYRPEVISGKAPLTVKDLYKGFSPIEHAAILAFCYLFRNLSKKTDKDEWEYVQAPLYEALSLGSAIGQSVPEIGLALGMLARGMRYLAFAPFVVGNRRGFKEYRRHLKANDLPFDLEFENKTWECNNIQVAAVLLQHIGFNRTAALQFVAAAEHDMKVQPDELWGIRFRMTDAVLIEYMETGEVPLKCPEWVGKEHRFPTEVRVAVLESFKRSLNEETRIEWLNKGSASINPDSTPEFFAGVGAETVTTPASVSGEKEPETEAPSEEPAETAPPAEPAG
jgi:hypothetical protein